MFKDKRPYHDPQKSGGAGSGSADASSGGGGDEWVAGTRERLLKHDQDVLKELTSLLSEFEDELLPSADAAEVLDVLGLLGDVPSGAASADAYLGLAA